MTIIDKPIAVTKEGRALYDNTPTVVAILACHRSSLLAVERGNEPGAGLIGLPGGYHMRGESWQEAGCRELWEETGFHLNPESVILVSVETDEYGNNLIIGKSYEAPHRGHDSTWKKPNEVRNVLNLHRGDLFDGKGMWSLGQWAFPRHYAAAVSFMIGMG